MPLSWFFDDFEENNETQLSIYTTCKNCVVRSQCLEWAIEVGFVGGFAGGHFFKEAGKGPKNRKRVMV
jgi:hypothetical protein